MSIPEKSAGVPPMLLVFAATPCAAGGLVHHEMMCLGNFR